MKRIYFLISFLLLLFPISLQAEIVVLASTDYDSNSPVYGFSYTYAGYGPAGGGNTDASGDVSSTFSLTDPNGNVGNAGSATVDTSGFAPPSDRNYDYVGWAVGTGINTASFTSSTLSDYTLTFDVRTSGGASATGGKVRLDLDTPDDVVSGGDADNFDDIAVQLEFANVDITDTWETHTLSLASGAFTIGDQTALSTFLGDINRVVFLYEAQSNLASLGTDNDNAILIDNISLSLNAVPEPSSTLLFVAGVGFAGFVRRRRISV